MTGSRSIFSRIFIVFLLLAIVPVTLSSLLIVASYDGLITQLTDNTIYEQLMPDLRVQTYNLLRDAMILVLVTVAITLTIAVFAALFISRTWGMPIRNLLLAIDQASKGDWNVRVPVRSADEFGELGRGFNLMVRRLSQIAAENQKAHEQLEQRVAERTAELTLAYEALKRSTDKINDANRLKTEFVANMSHELRTPLNAIIGYTDLVLDGIYGEPTDSQREVLTKTRTNADRLLRLITDVLDLAKIESGKMSVYPEKLDLMQLTTQVADSLRPLFDRKGLDLKVRQDGDIPRIFQDPGKLQQILTNFLSNAWKFTETGSVTVIVWTYAEQNFVGVDVVDTGVGIPEERLHEIFDQFRQLDGGTTRAAGGTGLGLALVRQLAELLGGTVKVESRVGHGSRFSVLLPVEYQERPEEAGPGLADEAAPVIFAVDDDPNVLGLISRLLEPAGYKIIRCQDGDELMRKADSVAAVAILLDLVMPYKDGWVVYEAIREHPMTRDVPVIMMNGQDPGDQWRRRGVDGFVAKPIVRENLIRELARVASPPVARSMRIERPYARRV